MSDVLPIENLSLEDLLTMGTTVASVTEVPIRESPSAVTTDLHDPLAYIAVQTEDGYDDGYVNSSDIGTRGVEGNVRWQGDRGLLLVGYSRYFTDPTEEFGKFSVPGQPGSHLGFANDKATLLGSATFGAVAVGGPRSSPDRGGRSPRRTRPATRRCTYPRGLGARALRAVSAWRASVGVFLVSLVGCGHARHHRGDDPACVAIAAIQVDTLPSPDCDALIDEPPGAVAFSLQADMGLTGGRGACSLVRGELGYTWLFALDGEWDRPVSCALGSCTFEAPRSALRHPVTNVEASAIDGYGGWANSYMRGKLAESACTRLRP